MQWNREGGRLVRDTVFSESEEEVSISEPSSEESFCETTSGSPELRTTSALPISPSLRRQKKMAAPQEETKVGVQPQTFDPKKTPVVTFLANFEIAAEANGWSELTRRKQLPCYLRGRAQEWIHQHLDLATYQEVVEGLKLAFKKPMSEERSMDALLDRKQGPTESSEDFLDEVERLLNVAIPDMLEVSKVRLIQKKLRPELHKAVAVLPIRTVEDLRETLLRVEAASTTGTPDAEGGQAARIGELRKQVEGLQRQLERQEISPRPKPQRYGQWRPPFKPGIHNLIEQLKELLIAPERHVKDPLVLAVDHCFLIKGKGTILTGTVLQGTIKLNDDIEIPILKEIKKVKSIQMFKNNVSEAVQGDRIGVCVKQFDPSQLERGLACTPGYILLLFGVIIVFNKVKYFKSVISSNNKYHISIGHETVMGKIKLFSSEQNSGFSFENDYAYIEKYSDEIQSEVYALIEFEKSVHVPPDSIIIGSKLDANIDSKTCRLAFYGNIVSSINDRNYTTTVLPKLKLFVIKEKNGIVQQSLNESEIIGLKLCKKHSSIQKFLNFKVRLSTGECGYIQGTFGQKDKVRIIITHSLKSSTLEMLSKQRKTKLNDYSQNGGKNEKKETIKIKLIFKRYLFDKDKKVSQSGLF